MMTAPCDWRRTVVRVGMVCAICSASIGCGDPIASSGIAHPGNQPNGSQTIDSDAVAAPVANVTTSGASISQQSVAPVADSPSTADDPAKPRVFEVEGPDGALRITFGDLDLLKLLDMKTITADCVERMPDWLRGLVGKKVRLRGYMKPGNLSEGIPQFLFVRSTDLCCFEPKGRVDHLIATTLKPGTTTSYIELKPFDVVGTFRIEMIQLDDGLIFLLYHVDDATIIRN